MHLAMEPPMTPILTTRLAEISERLEKATPGPYDARVREFSNHALCEVWTEFGWYQQLPEQYRQPTTTLFAFAPSDLQLLVEVCEVMREALKRECCCPGERSYIEPFDFIKCDACETLAKIEELCK